MGPYESGFAESKPICSSTECKTTTRYWSCSCYCFAFNIFWFKSLHETALFRCIGSELGQPHFFITFTCNPQWIDITRNLLQGEKPHDRPDIVARVFNLKLKELMSEITGGLFGPSVADVHVIEFQKRILPHADILLTLEQGHKPNTPELIDQFVCADLPIQ